MRVTIKARFPNLAPVTAVARPFWVDAGKVIAAGIVDNITRQRQASGARLKVNKASTRDRKRREGKPQFSLVDDEHRFVRTGVASWATIRFLPGGKGVVVGAATAELRELIGYVGAKGYKGYVGISRQTAKALQALLVDYLKKRLSQLSSQMAAE